MNWKTTFALPLFAAAAAALVFVGPELPRKLDPSASTSSTRHGATVGDLSSITPEALTRVEIRNPSGVTVFERKPDGAWVLPGGWPTRPAEVLALMDLLGKLRTRFVPEPATDIARFGLDRPPVTVFVEIGERKTGVTKHTLEFGQPDGVDTTNRFSRPTYLRMDGRDHVVRLGPGVLAALEKPTDYYQQRRLFPFERVAKEDNKHEKVERLQAKGIAVEDRKNEQEKKDGSRFELVKNDADGWKLVAPVSDRVEPRALNALLDAVPDIWAENFVKAAPESTGLATPERAVEVVREDGTKLTLLIGKVSSTRTRKVTRQPPPGTPVPPTEETVHDEFRYARLKDNDQIFEVRADKLKDLFVPLDTLRDPQVAHFKSDEVRRLEIEQPSGPIELTKDGDRWKLIRPVRADADAANVSELLSKLTLLEARGKEVIDNAKPADYGLDKPAVVVKLAVKEQTGEGEKKAKKSRALTLRIGKHDTTAKKVYVQVEGWPRVNAVEDSLVPLATRTALAYRGKRVLDLATTDLASVTILRGGDTTTLKQEQGVWKVTAPVAEKADAAKAAQLVAGLASLEALEYVADAAAADDLEKSYGLGASAISTSLTFADAAKPPKTLLVGKTCGAKPGWFAKLADSPAVFAVSDETHRLVDRDALAFLPLQLWKVPVGDVASVSVHRAGRDEYTLTPAAGGYRLTGEFEAPALAAAGSALLSSAADPVFDSVTTAVPKDLAQYGLDKPFLRVAVTDKAGKAHDLLVGNPAPKGGWYAKAKGRQDVGVISDKLLRSLDRPALALLDPALLALNAAKAGHVDADRIEIRAGDSSVRLERKGADWQVAGAPGAPFAADPQSVSGLTGLLLNLRAARFAAYGPKADLARFGLDKPSAVVTVHVPAADNKSAAEHTVELGGPAAGTPGGRYARVDRGPAVAILGPDAAQGLMRTALDFVNRDVLHLDASAVKLLQRHTGAAVLELAKRDEGWRIARPGDQRADDKTVTDLLNQLANLRAVRIAAYPAKDLASFGLDAPEAIFTIQGSGQSKAAEHTLKLGKIADAASVDRFAVADAGTAVAVLPGALVKRLLAEPIAFRDRTLAKFADADKLRLERGARRATFARVDGTWKLTEPLAADAEQEALDEFVDSLARLRADEFVAERAGPDELKAFGLDKPAARWQLLAGDRGLLTLSVGGPEKGGARRYAKLGDDSLVFLLDPKLSAKTLDEFRTRTVWDVAPDAAGAEAVRFGFARNPFTLEKVDGAWQVAGRPGTRVNTGMVNDTLSALSGLRIAHYAVDKGADLKLFGLEPPELTLEITTRDGKKTLFLGHTEGSSKRRYARVAGNDRNDVFVLNESDSARLFRELSAFTRPSEVPVPAAGR